MMTVRAVEKGTGRVRTGVRGAGSGTGPVLGTPLSFGSDLVAWWHADDATPSSWPDRSGNGYDLLQTTPGNRPTIATTGFMGKQCVVLDGATTFMKATGIALATDTFSAHVFAQQDVTTSGANRRLVGFEGSAVGNDFTGPGSAIFMMNQTSVGNVEGYRSGHLSKFELNIESFSAPTKGAFYRMSSVYDGANHTMIVDGQSAASVASSGSLASPGTVRVGSQDDTPASQWDGMVREIIFLKNSVSSRLQTINDHLARDWTRVLLTEGDSITYSPPANSGFTYLFLPNASPPVLLQNYAQGGSVLANLVSRAATNLYSKIPANKWGKKYIVFVGIGVNDIAHYKGLDSTAGPAQYAVDIASYCAGVKAAGADKVAISTITSRTDAAGFPDHDAYRNPYNAIIRNTSWQTANGIDAVVDFAGDSIMGVDQAPTVNPTYFVDEVHPSATGMTRLEPIFRAAINAL